MNDFSEIIAALEKDRRNVSNELKRLRAENEKLRAALKPFADAWENRDKWQSVINIDDLRAAAAVIRETGE